MSQKLSNLIHARLVQFCQNLSNWKKSTELEFDHFLDKPYFVVDILAILSVQHQTIHIYQLDTDLGGFCPIVNIGRTLFDDDELLLSRTGQSEGQQMTALPQRAFGNHPASQYTYRYC